MRGSVSGMGRRVRRTLAAALAVLLAITVSGAAAPQPASGVASVKTTSRALSARAAARQRHHFATVTAVAIRTAVATGGSVSGHVSDGTTGVQGMWIHLYDSTGSYVLSAQTNVNGDYVANGVPADTYIVQFDPSGLTGNPYVFQWYSASDTPDLATPITITDGGSTTAVDATLVTGGKSIAGVALDGAGIAAPGADVVLWQKYGSVWVDSLYATTDSTGHYSFEHIPDGSYRIQCWGENGVEWFHPGVPTVALGDDVVVSANPVETVDVVYSPQAVIDFATTSGGSPLGDVDVRPYFNTPHDGWQPVPGYAGRIGAFGTATVTGILPGDYKFEFSHPGYGTVYYQDAASLAAATPMIVGAAPASGPSVSITQAMIAGGGETDPPVTTIVGAPSGWVATDPSATFTSSDGAGGSGVAKTRWAWDGDYTPGDSLLSSGNVWDGSPVVFSDVLAGEAGKSGIWYWSIDANGNAETPRKAPLWVDKQAPVTTDDHIAAYGGSATIGLTADDPDSGVSYTHYDLDGTGEVSGITVTTTVMGPHTLEYWSADAVGNVESPHQTISFDVVPHEVTGEIVSISPAAPTTANSVTFTGKGSDTVGAHSVSVYEWRSDKDGVLGTAATFSKTLSAGTHTISLKVKCSGGSWSSPVTQQLTVTAPPFSGQNVYRFYNLKAGVHFYTASESEMWNVRNTLGNVYRFEGPSYTINLANPNNTLPVYRFYNIKKGVHFYTASEEEKDSVIRTLGGVYRFEGPSYRVSRTSANAFPVYRFYNLKQGVHFYTSSEAEMLNVKNTLGGVYRYEGISYWVGK